MWYIVQRFGDLPFYVVRAETDAEAVQRAAMHDAMVGSFHGTHWQVQELCTVDASTIRGIAAGDAVILGRP